MKIAVTYDQGEIFQHFGRCQEFKIYEVDGKEIKSSKVVKSMGSGHSALAVLLSTYMVDVLICGGIGEGARQALMEERIQLCAGASGDCDEAVQAFLAGELFSDTANCDHHHHEEGHECDCGDDCGGDCEGGCGGGCCGHHQQPQLLFEGKNAGKRVRVHYQGTFNDGTEFDSSYSRATPLEFICAAGQMIRGFDKAVVDMEVGQIVNIHLMPEEAYGQKDPSAIFSVPIEQLPGSENLQEGQRVYLTNIYGQPFAVEVVHKDDVNITFDANHEMAGKELNFKIELLEVM